MRDFNPTGDVQAGADPYSEAPSPLANALLRTIGADASTALVAAGRRTLLRPSQTLWRPGQRADAVCFPMKGLIAGLAADQDGASAQVECVGPDGAAGLIEGGLRLVTGGTDNHLILVDLTPADITGKEAEELLESVGVTCNKNQIPFDPRPPLVTSGIRLGTPAMTTRGFKESEMREVASIITTAIRSREDGSTLNDLKARVAKLCADFPLYN